MPPIAAPDSYSQRNGRPIFGGRPDPYATPPGAVLTTLTLQNESATEQAAGFVSPMFGLPLVKGHVPAGTYPQFVLEDGTYCPATLWGVTSWPDGSMKFCAGMIRVPASVAGSGSLVVEVQNGGTAPPASSRTTAELTAADLKVELTGVTNLTGNWDASLNTAITDNTEIVQVASGPAGAVWRILGDFKQASAAHGQLVCWHYVAALTNAAGGLLGLRYLGRVAQPWADVASPALVYRVATGALKSGAATVRNLQGYYLTETLGNDLVINHYTSFFTCGAAGTWDFIQGGGSATTDASILIKHSNTHLVTTKMLPPFDLSVVTQSNTPRTYYPNGNVGMMRDMGGTGERPEIAVVPSWCVRHLLNQTAMDMQVVRAAGLSSGGWRLCVRQKSTGHVIPGFDYRPSYEGLGATKPGVRWHSSLSGVTQGMGFPTATSMLWSREMDTSHSPAATYYPYLVTGEPQYLDMLTEQSASRVLISPTGARTMNTVQPITKDTLRIGNAYGLRDVILNGVTHKGAGFMFDDGQVRVQAWLTRDFAEAAAMYPDVCPQGSGLKQYLVDTLVRSYEGINLYNELVGPEWDNSGIFDFDPRVNGADPWCHGYMSSSICHQAAIYPHPEVIKFRRRCARHWRDIDAAGDIACAVSYDGTIYDQNGVRVNTSGQMLFGNNPNGAAGTYLTFSDVDNRFTVTDSLGAWSPTNGDVIAFQSGLADFAETRPFSYPADRTPMYVVNASGTTGQLSYSVGGPAIPVTNPVALRGFWMRLANFAPRVCAESYIGVTTYIANIRGAIRAHAASGDGDIITAARISIEERFTRSGVSFTNNDPKNAIASQYPE